MTGDPKPIRVNIPWGSRIPVLFCAVSQVVEFSERAQSRFCSPQMEYLRRPPRGLLVFRATTFGIHLSLIAGCAVDSRFAFNGCIGRP
jgi:hypothetical protein